MSTTIMRGQNGLTAEQLRLLKLGANAANAVYNVDYKGTGPESLSVGSYLDATGDLRAPAGGIPQPYESEPGWQVIRKVISAETGGKAVIFRNANTNEVMVAFAGMDGFSNGQDNGSGVVYNAACW